MKMRLWPFGRSAPPPAPPLFAPRPVVEEPALPAADISIELVTLAPLAASWPDRQAAVSAGITHAQELAPADFYTRRAPLMLDTDAADPDAAKAAREYAGVLDHGYEAVHAVRLAGATVVGQGAVIGQRGQGGGALLRESVAEYVAHGLVPEGLRHGRFKSFVLDAPVTRRVPGTSLLLKRPWYRNYGHFMIDAGALLALAVETHPWPFNQIIIGPPNSDAMRTVVEQVCRLLAPGVPLLEQPDDVAWRCDDLLYVMPVHVPPLFKLPAALYALRQALLRAAETAYPRGPARRIYLPRRTDARRVLNDVELSAALHRAGFEEFDPESMPLLAQVALFRDASCVVGTKGAALTNTLFCRPGCGLVVLTPSDFPDPFFWDLASQMQLRCAELFGPIPGVRGDVARSDFFITPERVLTAVKAVSGDLPD